MNNESINTYDDDEYIIECTINKKFIHWLTLFYPLENYFKVKGHT